MLFIFIAISGLLSFLFSFYLYLKLKSFRGEGLVSDSRFDKAKEISNAIADGAMTFLNVEYKYISIFVLVFSLIIYLFIGSSHSDSNVEYNLGLYTALSFIFGCVMSLLSGYNGMKIATVSNIKTTLASVKSIEDGFITSLRGGAIMGFVLVGLCCLSFVGLYLLLFNLFPLVDSYILMESLAGFGLGASSMALFCRVGGGIFTKAADVGADLSGKVENSIPEDDPRNPAVIADNVGDNVGDIAGMGSDLFGSCAEATCAALVIGASSAVLSQDLNSLILPVVIVAIGIISSLISYVFAKVRTVNDVERTLKNQLLISSFFTGIFTFFYFKYFFAKTFSIYGLEITNFDVFYAFLSGLISGLFIGYVTEYFTSHRFSPVKEVAFSSKTGAATNIIFGLSLGYKSTIIPVILISATIIISYSLAGMFGIAIAAIGMISNLATALMIDAYGPIADNAGGIAEMCELDESVRDVTDVLDSAGNTTAAIGKGFAIGSAALTSLALFAAFVTRAFSSNEININLFDPWVFGGLVIGAMLPYWFSAMTMKSVGFAALSMVEEVRRQFQEFPGILSGERKPDYKSCVDISTTAALKEMVGPALLVVFTPLFIGYIFGLLALCGVLAGTLVSGISLAISSSNSGGAWDNAKKYIESGALGQGNEKGSDCHKASVIGDTVGDPFKDTSGPSLNILIKLMAIISLVFADSMAEYGGIIFNIF